ncbi:hypothetical protein C6496_08215 [Candidatus Poribacteria bacterium]|nr:MAG: hypothetical protein C6496_08215 [Candidatus Poribacteria bacterium]
MLYLAVAHYQTDGGIVISASHNPAEYNGMKLVGPQATPISADTGILELRNAVENGVPFEKQKTHCRGSLQSPSLLKAYLTHLHSFVDLQQPRRQTRNQVPLGNMKTLILTDTNAVGILTATPNPVFSSVGR